VREDHWLRPLLTIPLVVRIGAVSYGIYLMHGIVYNAVEGAGARIGLSRYGVPMFIAVTLLTLLVASASFRYYESIFLRMKSRFGTPKALVTAAR
jgi:peptidoglycan/LPS O-acetylase OafA/YrhL